VLLIKIRGWVRGLRGVLRGSENKNKSERNREKKSGGGNTRAQDEPDIYNTAPRSPFRTERRGTELKRVLFKSS
jgi:hypothetical protein